MGHYNIIWQVDKTTNYSETTCWSDTPSPDNPDANKVPQGPFAVPKTLPRSARPCVPDPQTKQLDSYNSSTGQITSGEVLHKGQPAMSLMGIDPSWCQGIKDLGVTMTTLYVQFGNLKDYSTTDTRDWFRNEWRYIFLNNYVIPNLPSYMSQCASSPAEAFTANDAASVQNAFNTIFGKYLSAANVRLTH